MNQQDLPPYAIGVLLRNAHRRAAERFGAALEPLGIENRHFGVLTQLSRGPHSQRELIELTTSDKATMVRMIDDLESRGLAERRPDPTDRRMHAVHLTKKGRDTFTAAEQIARDRAAELLTPFQPDEQRQLISLLSRFVAQFDET